MRVLYVKYKFVAAVNVRFVSPAGVARYPDAFLVDFAVYFYGARLDTKTKWLAALRPCYVINYKSKDQDVCQYFAKAGLSER